MTANEKADPKKQAGKRRFTLPFTIFGLVWGIASFVFLLTETGKEKPANFVLYLIFLPVLLNVWFLRLVAIFGRFDVNPSSAGDELLILFTFYFLPILFGIISGWLIGVTIDKLVAYLKPTEQNGR